MRLIDADKLCEDLLERWSVADTRKEELIRRVMADIVTPIIASQPNINQQSHWIPCSEYPEYDFEDVLIRWHDKRKGCEDDYILCEGYVVRKHWCCIFEDVDMSDYEPVEWQPLSSLYREEGEEE